MLRFIHTADIHLGARLLKLGEKVEDQRVQIQLTFEKIIDRAIEDKVDLVIIAGDLFDKQVPDKQLVDFFLSNIARLNDRHIYSFIALGTHDFVGETSPFGNVDFANLPYVKIFNDPKVNSYAIDELSTIVYCNCSVSNKSGESPLAGISRNGQYKYNIAIGHGSVQIPGKSNANDSPITLEEIENSKMDYIALGHWHNQQQVGKGSVKAWYSGAPEMIDLDQYASGKILEVSISDENLVNVESIQVGKRYFDSINVSADSLLNQEDLINKIRQNANSDLIRSVVIEGLFNLEFGTIDEEEIRRRLKDQFFYLLIKNNAHVSLDNLDIIGESNILKQKFIENIRGMGKDEDVTNDALQFGIMLLDGNAKVY